MVITSTKNELVKYWVKLKQSKYRKQFRQFIVEGEHLIEEALKADVVVHIISLEAVDFQYEDIPNTLVAPEIMAKLSTNTSLNKVIAVCNFMKEFDRELDSKIIVLDQVQDPANVGAIIRTSLALGYQSIILSDESVDIYNEKLLKATQGALFKVKIVKGDLIKKLNSLFADGYELLAADLSAKITLNQIKPTDKFCLIFGNEGKGISQEVLNLSSIRYKIPMHNEFDSLNILSAVSIALYHFNNS